MGEWPVPIAQEYVGGRQGATFFRKIPWKERNVTNKIQGPQLLSPYDRAPNGCTNLTHPGISMQNPACPEWQPLIWTRRRQALCSVTSPEKCMLEGWSLILPRQREHILAASLGREPPLSFKVSNVPIVSGVHYNSLDGQLVRGKMLWSSA